MEGSIYWPAVAAASAIGFSISLAQQLYTTHQRDNTLIPLPRGVPRTAGLVLPEGAEPCKACKGARKVTCPVCDGLGRTNLRTLLVLPKGVNPVWCVECKAAGRMPCGRCMGTGIRPNPIGFRM